MYIRLVKNIKGDYSLYNNKSITESNKIIITENYVKKPFKRKVKFSYKFSKRTKIIIALIYFIVIIWIETLYRDYLFHISIPFEENFQKDDKYKIILKLCKIISLFGAEISTLFLFGIIFLFMPLNHTFIILQSIVYSSYLTNTLKMIYQSDRPNWRSNILTYTCNYGYGNPSGHSFTSTCLYLCLSHILVCHFKITKKNKIFIFSFFILFITLIILSRIILASHSINQVLYGFSLGIGLYFILIHIIGYHKYSFAKFLRHIRNKKVNYVYNIFHVFLLLFTIFIFFIIKPKEHSDIEKSIFNGIRCKIKKPYLKYKNEGLSQSLSITSLIGAQFGMILLMKVLKKKNYLINTSIIEWNKTKLKKFFLRIPIIFLSSLGIFFNFFIPVDLPLIIIFIFKSGVPFFLCLFGIHFFGIFLCINLHVANSEIYKMDVLHELISST